MKKVILTVTIAMFIFGGFAQATICEGLVKTITNPILVSEGYNDGFDDSCKASRTGYRNAVDSERASSDTEYLRGVNQGRVVCSKSD